jgi:hypothetical protein
MKPLGSMIKKGVGAVKQAIGQTPPTPDQVHDFLNKKQIPNAHQIAQTLIKLNVLPHTKMSASTLKYTDITNRNRWDHLLRVAGVSNRLERFNILNDLAKADIAPWMPLVEQDSVS